MARPVTATSQAAERLQLDLLRRAGPARRGEVAQSLSTAVIEMARAAIARRHPEYSEREVLLAFVEASYGAELAARVRRHLDERR
jgi:hypothetical protein